MIEYLEEFRSAFPELPPLHPLLGELASLGDAQLREQQMCRLMPHLARRGDVDAALRSARGIVASIPPAWDAELVTGLVAVADELQFAEQPTSTRDVVEVLVQVAERGGLSCRGLFAVAALIHHRAGDTTLAATRMRRFDGMPEAEEPLHIAWYARNAQHMMLGDYVDRLLGWSSSRSVLPAEEAERLELSLWRSLLPGAGRQGWMEVEAHLVDLGARDAVSACTIAAAIIVGLRRLLGELTFPDTQRESVFSQLEQLVWLVPPPERARVWASLASAAAAANDGVRAERLISEALNALNQNQPYQPPSLVDFTADLLDARTGYPERTSSSTDEVTKADDPAVPPHLAADERTTVDLPESLTEVLRDGAVVLVAGPELPAARGAPDSAALLRNLVSQMEALITDAGRSQLLAAIDAGTFDTVIRLLRSLDPELDRRVAMTYTTQPAGEAYDFLAQTSLAGVISMTWDPLLLTAFEHHSPVVVHSGSADVLTAARSQDFTFTWLAGDPSTGRLALSSQELRTTLAAGETFARFVGGIVQSSPLLFVGVRAADIAEFFDALPGSTSAYSNTGPPQRFAVCAIDDLFELNRSSMRSLYEVELIGYDPAESGALAAVIEQISYLTRPIGGGVFVPPTPPQGATLSRVLLTNIGAFEFLDLQLSPVWNLLLGNNGCGKSTVLRAVALGLCGDHPRAIEAGDALLRAGTDTGMIELHVGASRYVTELRRSGGSVRVTTTSLTPLQQGNWVVLGFPALRGMSLAGPIGISAPSAPEPRVEDLLPLLFGEVDHRLDDIKQWIINVDARARQNDDGRSRQLLDRFFAVLAELTPGLEFEFADVDAISWQVHVRTDDGVITIDQLSQGMNSIIAWVGTLLQRMYDIYPNSAEPAAEPAFLLIDELDAHLHPEWQRILPSLTRSHFPKVQYLATSHSPLVAASLTPGELFVARRELRDGADGDEHLLATIEVADIDPHGLRADQILTSPLFDMMTSRSPRFEADAKRYDRLIVKLPRTPTEEEELKSLAVVLRRAYTDGETPADRDAAAAASAELKHQLATMEPDPVRLRAVEAMFEEAGEEGLAR